MRISELSNNIREKKTYLCLGLDTDIEKIPEFLLNFEDPVFEFNKSLIDRLHSKIIAVKINTAFYEARGVDGWISLEKTIKYINDNYPQGRVTDHRINLTLYDLQNIVNGDIEKLIDELKVAQNTELMKTENENL